jgi:diguanylate cyclase (GGDEF)-like protein/PAS domain S-box-containing protein
VIVPPTGIGGTGACAMKLQFTGGESSALYGLLAENTADIIIKTDREGFVVHASPAISQLGVTPPSMLIWPHLLDLIDPSYRPAIAAEHAAVIGGRHAGSWIEFRAFSADGSERWFAVQMRCLRDDDDEIYGALGIMRNIDEKRSYEERLFATAMTDQLTGLSNRRAFVWMLQHLVETQSRGCLAIFDIDHFRAINLQYGQSTGDEVLVAFADFLRALTPCEDVISRIGGESLGVLLLRKSARQAEAICEQIIDTLREIGPSVGPDNNFAVTASVGIARIDGSVDDTIRRAELALFFAKTKGRGCVEISKDAGQPWSSHAQFPKTTNAKGISP